MFSVFKKTGIIPYLPMVFMLASCASTSLTESWLAPEAGKSYQHPMIIGISDSQQTRRIYENNFVSELARRKITATPSYTLINSKEQVNRENVVKAIAGTDIDSVLVTYLVSADTELRVQDSPLNTSYSGGPDDNQISATMITQRGRPSSSEVISLKNDFYDVKTAKLVWSAKTRTVAPESIDDAIIEVTNLLIKQMVSDDLFN